MPFQKTNPISRRALLPLIATTALAPALLVPSKARAQGANWQMYRRDDLGFEIEVPGKPKVTVETGERDDPWVRSINAEIDFDEMTFGVSYNEFREAASIEQVFTAQRMAAQQLGIKAPRERAITINGFPGGEFIGESDDFSLVLRIVVKEKRSIGAAVTGRGRLSENPAARRFLDSFKLLP